MTPIFPPAVLIPLHGIIQLFSNTSRVLLSYKKVNFKIFILFAIGAGIGSILGIPAIASFLSLFVGATGPLTALFFLNSELDKDSFVPTKAACQIPIHLFKVIVG
jgi:uncharacterized membrane protein YfcA